MNSLEIELILKFYNQTYHWESAADVMPYRYLNFFLKNYHMVKGPYFVKAIACHHFCSGLC